MENTNIFTLDYISYLFDCPSCRRERKTLITADKFRQVENRQELIQNIFNPAKFPSNYREIFVTGFCSECQSKIFMSNMPSVDVGSFEDTAPIEPIINKMYTGVTTIKF